MEYNAQHRIKFRHLQAFTTIARLESFKAAADQLAITQPAISKTLKDLEHILGVPLMTRDRGGVALTEDGAAFLTFAEQSLAALSYGLSNLSARTTGHAAPLRLGALPSVAASLLPDAIMRFRALSPGAPVHIEEGSIISLLERLKSGHLDLVLGRLGPAEAMTGLSFTQLYSEQVVFAAASDHPLDGTKDLHALEGWPVLYPPQTAAIRSQVDRYLIGKGINSFPERIETVSDSFGRSMTLGPAKAIWIISRSVVARDIENGRMTALPFDTREMIGPIGVVSRADADPMPPVRLFRQAISECMRSRNGSP